MAKRPQNPPGSSVHSGDRVPCEYASGFLLRFFYVVKARRVHETKATHDDPTAPKKGGARFPSPLRSLPRKPSTKGTRNATTPGRRHRHPP